MLFIRCPTDLTFVDDSLLRDLVSLRLSQLSNGEPYTPEIHGELLVVQPGDRVNEIERAVGFPILTNVIDGTRYGEADFTPASEVIEAHATAFEIVFATHDDFGFAVFVPKHPSIDVELMRFCVTYAVPAAVPPR